MSELWIPIIGIICIALVIIASLYLGTREKLQLHKTLQQHLENGGELTPMLLQQMGANVNQTKRDKRKGALLTSIGLACFAGGYISGFTTVGVIFGVFPLFVGLAFCCLSLLIENE